MLTESWMVKVTVAAGLGGVCVWFLNRRQRLPPDQLGNRLVAITGCDSGVGYSTALHCHNQGLIVLALVLHSGSAGAQSLISIGKMTGRMEVVGVDVTQPDQVSAAIRHATSLLNNKALVFHALINNAGIMVFGETEWQTEQTVALQLGVNLAGAIRVAKLFAPLLRAYKARVINVSSHCASLPLPGLAVYAASKAGLQAWSDALRVEWAKYGVTVISLKPGALFQQTNILSRQMQYAQEMQEAMTVEAAGFYGDYFAEYQSYLSGLAGEKLPTAVESRQLYLMLNSALLDCHPQPHYHDTPWRYAWYHTLAVLLPTRLRDCLVTRFTAMPVFKKGKSV